MQYLHSELYFWHWKIAAPSFTHFFLETLPWSFNGLRSYLKETEKWRDTDSDSVPCKLLPRCSRVALWRRRCLSGCFWAVEVRTGRDRVLWILLLLSSKFLSIWLKAWRHKDDLQLYSCTVIMLALKATLTQTKWHEVLKIINIFQKSVYWVLKADLVYRFPSHPEESFFVI